VKSEAAAHSHSVILATVLAAVLLSLGCGESTDQRVEAIASEAKELVRDLELPEGLDAEALESLKRELSVASERLRSQDFEGFREKVTSLDTYIAVKVFQWHAAISEAYDADGPESALACLAGFRETHDIQPHESDALDEIAAALENGAPISGDEVFFKVFFHSLRPRYGDTGAMLILTAVAGAQFASRFS
jgi:hypothetical protein